MRALLWLVALGVALGAQAQSPDDLLRAGDELDAKNRNQEAVEIFLKADALQPNDAEILRRIAKQYSLLVVST